MTELTKYAQTDTSFGYTPFWLYIDKGEKRKRIQYFEYINKTINNNDQLTCYFYK